MSEEPNIPEKESTESEAPSKQGITPPPPTKPSFKNGGAPNASGPTPPPKPEAPRPSFITRSKPAPQFSRPEPAASSFNTSDAEGISIVNLVVDAIVAALAVAFMVLLLQDVLPFLN